MNLPTKPRHPSGMKMCSELHGDMQKPRIKRCGDNTTVLGGGTVLMGILGLVGGATL
jgi:hypothetical protein